MEHFGQEEVVDIDLERDSLLGIYFLDIEEVDGEDSGDGVVGEVSAVEGAEMVVEQDVIDELLVLVDILVLIGTQNQVVQVALFVDSLGPQVVQTVRRGLDLLVVLVDVPFHLDVSIEHQSVVGVDVTRYLEVVLHTVHIILYYDSRPVKPIPQVPTPCPPLLSQLSSQSSMHRPITLGLCANDRIESILLSGILLPIDGHPVCQNSGLLLVIPGSQDSLLSVPDGSVSGGAALGGVMVVSRRISTPLPF